MPPIKFKPTEKNYDRRTDKHSIVHHYMKATSKKDLFDYLNSSNATPKKTHKVLKELQRRGIPFIISILFVLTGCSTTKSSNTSATWYCLNKVFEYEDKCNCTLYPRGVTKETYCDAWGNLTLQGHNVKLEIPTN